jgi:hypothetical protein
MATVGPPATVRRRKKNRTLPAPATPERNRPAHAVRSDRFRAEGDWPVLEHDGTRPIHPNERDE